MKRKYIIWYILLIQFACTPNNKQTFKSQEPESITEIKGELINSSLMMTMARDIDAYKDFLVIRTFSDNNYLHILNKNTGHILVCLAAKGEGPKEVTDLGDQIQIDKEGNLYWFDNNRKRLFDCNIDSIVNFSSQYNITDFSSHNTFIDLAFSLKDKHLLAIGDKFSDSNDIQRYAICDSTNIISCYSGFPIIKDDTRNLEKIYFNYRGSQHVALSPDLSKFATAELYGGILEIFHLSDSISCNSIHPIYKYQKDKLQGFVDIYATDSLIYAIKADSNLNGNDQNNKHNKIMVFDWDGNCIKTYQADYNLLTLCIDEQSSRLYAVGMSLSLDSELQVLSFNI